MRVRLRFFLPSNGAAFSSASAPAASDEDKLMTKIRISRGEKQARLHFSGGEVSKAKPKIRKVEAEATFMFDYAETEYLSTKSKIRKVGRRNKRQLDYAETEYLRRSQYIRISIELPAQRRRINRSEGTGTAIPDCMIPNISLPLSSDERNRRQTDRLVRSQRT